MEKEINKVTHVVSFSGGRSSALLVWLMLIARKRFNWNVKFIFCDTGVEAPATYKFIRDIVKFWRLDDLIILRAKINPVLGQGNSYEIFTPNDLMNSSTMPPFQPFFDLIKKYGTPSVSRPFCSERMKKNVFDAYCKDHIGDHVTWLGMRSDEPKRLKTKDGIKYLADLIYVEKQDVLDWWCNQPFDLQLPENQGNCLYCPKKSSLKIAATLRETPHFKAMWDYYIGKNTVRIIEDYDPKVMYRGKLSLDGVAALYKDVTDDELYSKMKLIKGRDFGECSESCEPISFGNVNFGEIESNIRSELEDSFALNQFNLPF
ncbi:MAG: phosphoadenosine phosphosulfate reductase family protein [Vibrio sp.]